MKKILYSLFAVGLLLTSCDMDVKIPGALDQNSSVESVDDLNYFRNRAYGVLRAVSGGSWVTDPDLQADYYIGLNGNGGRTSSQIQGNYTVSSSIPSSKYQAAYKYMRDINFAIPEGERLIENGDLSEADILVARRDIGEMKFVRAYLYTYLFDHFCQSYSEDKADLEGYGCQLVTTYDPAIPAAKYPGRSSMNATLELINKDLTEAYDAISAYQRVDGTSAGACASYLNVATVRALQARVALLSKNYNKAYEYAKEVTTMPGFSLANGDDYVNMWKNDESTELLFVPYASNAEMAGAFSFFDTYNYISEFPNRVNCIPTMYWLAQYDDTDIRFEAFFDAMALTIDAQSTAAFVFIKYPGNPALKTSQADNYANKAKPFRLSEQYLILAEAAYETSKPSEALYTLNALRAARHTDYTPVTLSGLELRDAIRLERGMELIGEGFRFSDLKRWGLGFTRYARYGVLETGYADVATLFVDNDANTEYIPGDYRYTWPIPYDEMQVCNALKGQQNPGYE